MNEAQIQISGQQNQQQSEQIQDYIPLITLDVQTNRDNTYSFIHLIQNHTDQKFQDYIQNPSSQNLSEKQISLFQQKDFGIQLFLYFKNEKNILRILNNMQVNFINQQQYFKNCGIAFNKIRTLNIGMNYIETIEPLVYLNMPELQNLQFFQNSCISLKSFSKLRLKKLKTLHFAVGQIKNLKGLERCQFLDLKNIFAYQNKLINFTELFKLNKLNLKNLILGQQLTTSMHYRKLFCLQKKFKSCAFQ